MIASLLGLIALACNQIYIIEDDMVMDTTFVYMGSKYELVLILKYFRLYNIYGGFYSPPIDIIEPSFLKKFINLVTKKDKFSLLNCSGKFILFALEVVEKVYSVIKQRILHSG